MLRAIKNWFLDRLFGPVIPPPPGAVSGTAVGRRADEIFMFSDVTPRLVNIWLKWGNRYRRTEWWGPYGTFVSVLINPFGVPRAGQRKRCLQWYSGIKLDGTLSLERQAAGERAWYAYVFTPAEQRALRIHVVDGTQSAYNMGGS